MPQIMYPKRKSQTPLATTNVRMAQRRCVAKSRCRVVCHAMIQGPTVRAASIEIATAYVNVR
jgi:hypothetical protein